MTVTIPMPKANLEQLKHQAKDALKAHRRRDPSCCGLLRHLHPFKGKTDEEILSTEVKLSQVQFALSMEKGLQVLA